MGEPKLKLKREIYKDKESSKNDINLNKRNKDVEINEYNDVDDYDEFEDDEDEDKDEDDDYEEDNENNENDDNDKKPIYKYEDKIIDSISSCRLTYELLVMYGSFLSFKEFLNRRTNTSHQMEFIRKMIISEPEIPTRRKNEGRRTEKRINEVSINKTYDIKYYGCPAEICGNISSSSNPVHCPAPECIDDPHHIMFNGFTYWCPICKNHSTNKYKCSINCNNCDTHNIDCLRLKNDFECRSLSCSDDPHHHNGIKRYYKYCDNCYKCHHKNDIFCNKCKECFSKKNEIHCIASSCVTKDPHHYLIRKFQQVCINCGRCHRQPSVRCDKCDDCFFEKNMIHCTDLKCKYDPHHLNSLDGIPGHKRKTCKLCSQCHP